MTSRLGRRLAAALGAGVLIAGFQNCQEYQIAEDVSLGEAEFQNREDDDKRTLAELMALPEAVAAYSSKNAVESAGLVTSVVNSIANTLFVGTTFDLAVQNLAYSPSLTPGSLGEFYVQHVTDSHGAIVLETSTGADLFSEAFSIVMVVKPQLFGDIVSISDGTRKSEDAALSVDASSVVATHWTSSTKSSYARVALPTSGDRLIIAASFGTEAGKIRVMVNGVSSSEVTATTGTNAPQDFSYIARQFRLGGSLNGSQLAWGEVRIFLKELTGYELSVLSRDLAKRWGVSGVVDDLALREDDGSTGGATVNPNFAPAKAAVTGGTCSGCHNNATAFSFSSMSYSQFKALIVPRDPANSQLIKCPASGCSSSHGGTMGAVGGFAGSSIDTAIRDWINSEN